MVILLLLKVLHGWEYKSINNNEQQMAERAVNMVVKGTALICIVILLIVADENIA
ncbi:hypothetical protein [Undibacterium terreum]|uniref:hypothetical protein n=1 Tax=Undibacterium terreum TaxID=1224302 RepID=UPI0016650C1E|nr:hypothetical protein [Undibacterium terreum]